MQNRLTANSRLLSIPPHCAPHGLTWPTLESLELLESGGEFLELPAEEHLLQFGAHARFGLAILLDLIGRHAQKASFLSRSSRLLAACYGGLDVLETQGRAAETGFEWLCSARRSQD